MVYAVYYREGQVNQQWETKPGQSKAVLRVEPNGSRTVTVSGLAAVYTMPAGDPLGQPLAFAFSFNCG